MPYKISLSAEDYALCSKLKSMNCCLTGWRFIM